MSLKILRAMRGLTQADVANYLGITRAAYTNIENGKRQLNATLIIKLADILQVSSDEILDRFNVSLANELKLDERLTNLLVDLSPVEVQRVIDFVVGLKAARPRENLL